MTGELSSRRLDLPRVVSKRPQPVVMGTVVPRPRVLSGTIETVTPPSNDKLDDVVRELNEMCRAHLVDGHLKLGRVIIERLYGGDLRAWRKNGPREISFRRLAARTQRDLKVSSASLYRAVALCELSDRLGVASWRRVGVSHLRAVLGLPQPEQRRLLAAVEEGQWTVERLEAETAKLRRAHDTRRGRPRLPGFVKIVHRLDRLFADHADAPADEAELSDAELVRLRDMLVNAKRRIEALQQRLEPSARRR